MHLQIDSIFIFTHIYSSCPQIFSNEINPFLFLFFSFNLKDSLAFIMHMFTPSPMNETPELQCPNCLRMYKTPAKLRAHMKKYCLKEKKYPCFFCDYRSKRRDHIRRHMASIHAEQLVKRQKAGLSMEIVDSGDRSEPTIAIPDTDGNEENDDDYDDDYEEDSDEWKIRCIPITRKMFKFYYIILKYYIPKFSPLLNKFDIFRSYIIIDFIGKYDWYWTQKDMIVRKLYE